MMIDCVTTDTLLAAVGKLHVALTMRRSVQSNTSPCLPVYVVHSTPAHETVVGGETGPFPEFEP